MSACHYHGRPIVAGLLCAAMLAATGDRPHGAAAEEPLSSRGAMAGFTGFTAPSRQVTLAMVRMGRIAEMPFREGDFVEAGAVMIHLDDAVQRRRVAITEALANSTLEIEIAEVRFAQALRELQWLRDLAGTLAVSNKELADAQAEADAATLALAHAQFKREQAVRELSLQKALLDELNGRAPFAGYVAERLREVGDTVDENEPVLKLVRLDPLEVCFDCPLSLVQRIKPGQRVTIQPVEYLAEARVGEVVFASRVADAASQTLKIKVHVPNGPGDWLVGMQVNIDFAKHSAVPPRAGSVTEVDAPRRVGSSDAAVWSIPDDPR